MSRFLWFTVYIFSYLLTYLLTYLCTSYLCSSYVYSTSSIDGDLLDGMSGERVLVATGDVGLAVRRHQLRLSSSGAATV